ncbi:MAG: hypothetical protein Q8L55_02100 [Phycisphaerales bacterium]|nr:hypothetical protein [Phycisphaerales bacterium]
MQAVTATDFTTQFALDIQRAQRDALQTIHKIMLHLAQSITSPAGHDHDEGREEAAQARTTTQRIRLCLQAARDILRLAPPPNVSALPPSPAEREKVAEALQGRLRVPFDSPHDPRGGSPGTSSDSANEPRTNLTPHPKPTKPTNTLHAAAGPEASRPGERITPPRDSSLIAHTSASSSSPPSAPLVVNPPLPPQPQYFTDQERKQILATMRAPHERFTQDLYDRIIEWNHYARAAGLPRAFGIKYEDIEAREPLATEHAQSAPTSK